MLRFDEVVFIDDFFRSSVNGLASHPNNRRFLRSLFAASCSRLGIAVRDACAASDGGRVRVDLLMDRLGLERSSVGWARASISDLSNVLVEDLSLQLRPRSLVIGWGLPPSLLCYVDGVGAAFLDVEVDPLRFTQHLHLCARTNDAQILSVLRTLEIPVESFWDSASTVRAYFARRGADYLVAPGCRVGLFAGQTEVDLALVQDGRLTGPLDFIDKIGRWATEVDVLLVKRHPYAGDHGGMQRLVQEIPNAALVDHNIYGMFAARNLGFVAALSSGVLKECRYFGLEARALTSPDRSTPERLPTTCSPWVTIPADIANIDVMKRMTHKLWRWRRFVDRRIEAGLDADALDRIFGARWGLDANAPGLPATQLATAMRVYRFAQGAEAVGWLSSGWHEVENWGVWSSAPRCGLIVPVDREGLSTGRCVKLEFLGTPFQSASITGIDLNGEVLCPTCETIGETTVVRVSVSSKQFGEQSIAVLGFHVERASRPADINEQPDSRLLGFGLMEHKIEIDS